MGKRVLIAVLVLVIVSLAFAPTVLADETKDYYWKSINVDLDIRSDSTVRVTETHTYAFTVGSFSHVYRVIPMGRVESIDGIEVWEGNSLYRQASGQTAGTYTVERSGAETKIDWWFPKTSGRSRSSTRCTGRCGSTMVATNSFGKLSSPTGPSRCRAPLSLCICQSQ